jgi:hypothetical protein
MPETPETAMTRDVPAELKRILDDAAGKEHSTAGPVMRCLADILTAHEAMVRADERRKVAEELREDADAHRRLVARKPSQHDEARLARAKTLDEAAARITRGEELVRRGVARP